MKGVNRFEINQATMKDIVQHYFDTVLFTKDQSPEVTGINSKTDGFFYISTSEREGPKNDQ